MLSKSIASRSLLAQCVGIGFSRKVFKPAQTKFADPIRVVLHVGDVMDRLLAQADAGVVRVIYLVVKIADVPVDVDSLVLVSVFIVDPI